MVLKQRVSSVLVLIGWLGWGVGLGHSQTSGTRPNIVLIYADDIGFGDLSCNGATAVQTPNIDRIAREGLRFTDGHCPAATCTPSRYALMTGEYAFRKKGTGVLPGDAPLILPTDRTTLPKLMVRAGYSTAAIGKWHLGLGGPEGPEWNGTIKPGPAELGFGKSFLIPATGDRVPCVYVEDGKVRGLDPNDPIRVSYKGRIGDAPTGKERPDLLKMKWDHGHDMTIVNGISRIGYMTGGRTALWNDETMADDLTKQAVDFIQNQEKKPFFLYFALHDIHVPRVPHPRFVGKTSMGPRGDCIVQADWSVGQILEALDKLGLTKDTLVIFTSDNGPVINDGYVDQAVSRLGDHKPAGPYRGGKYSNFEGGTRVPFLVRWPAKIQPGVSRALVSQVDFLRSFARLLDQKLETADSPDGVDQLEALLGKDPIGRDHLILQANRLSLREGSWKYIEPSKGPKRAAFTDTELGSDPDGMLFDLKNDIGEKTNLVKDHPDRAKAMAKRLESLRKAPANSGK